MAPMCNTTTKFEIFPEKNTRIIQLLKVIRLVWNNDIIQRLYIYILIIGFNNTYKRILSKENKNNTTPNKEI